MATETQSPPPGRPAFLVRWGRALLPPLGAFVLARGLLFIAAFKAGQVPWLADAWVRWDSGHYLSIAANGFILHPCGPDYGGPSNWCGNAGWMPGYPRLIGLLSHTGLAPAQAGVLLSALFSLGLLVLLWTGFLGQRAKTLPVLGLAALFPGQVYQHAVFPISMCLFFSLLCLFFQERRRPVLAGLAGGVAAFSYTTGFLLAPVVLGAELLAPGRSEGSPWPRWGRGVVMALGVMLGFVAALAVFQAQTGAWNALFLSQAKYGHGLGNPLDALEAVVGPLLRGESRHWKNASPRVQTLLVALMVLVLVARPLSRWREMGQRERWLALYGLAFWLFPLVMGRGVSLYRAESLLVPLALLAWRPAVAGMWLVLAAALVVPMGRLFFLSILV
ncbi:hypothetical protein CYFUS_007395 [Cystobacter fuscus]|uniref:Glycosyltransferase RgtA/B/C/D-like domain-containing protein n=1 Tax=Cystobacter fuscus TaxID=43 RepID=A0A250JDD2_9BACT|nr:hypothetical protein [Cystobacter fuscus]ATB41919.1 hypothetical protein CYFUS_007395 [Cystobacter fuscus]